MFDLVIRWMTVIFFFLFLTLRVSIDNYAWFDVLYQCCNFYPKIILGKRCSEVWSIGTPLRPQRVGNTL